MFIDNLRHYCKFRKRYYGVFVSNFGYNLFMTHQNTITSIMNTVEQVIAGKRDKIELALAVFLARGHLLIDDLPGVGKTTLAKTLSKALGLHYNRIQFTSDMLPSDILGLNYFDTQNSTFRFKKGPLFSQFLLADEINRASPKTQSALLEAMEESQVSIDGVTHSLPNPFFVVATKNPFEEAGTFELPTSQLDRFMISFSLGYPDPVAERSILQRNSNPFEAVEAVVDAEVLKTLFEAASQIHLASDLLDFLQEIIVFSRESGLFYEGLSTRAAIALSRVSQAYALIRGRDFVTPEDVKTILPHICAHRLRIRAQNVKESASALILASVHPDL